MFVERLESRLCLAAALDSAEADDESSLVAFPGAEGFGRFAQGGRGGDVYHVQNVNNNGSGSFREGINTASGPRTIVFDVSGTIFLDSDLRIENPYITIAGETAPGDGITLAGDSLSITNTHDVIVRYIRSRPGDILEDTQGPESRDAVTVSQSTDIILDHVSGAWSTDEVFAFTGPGDITIQWSIASEALNESFHPKGAHSDGSLNVNGNMSLHHNLFVSNKSRNPKVQQFADVVNNVVYNFDFGALIGLYGGDDLLGPTEVNLEGNYYIAGPNTSSGTIARQRMVRLFEEAQIWTNDNLVDFNRNDILDGSLATNANIEFHDSDSSPEGIVVENRFDYPQVTTSDAATAYEQVLEHAGASLVRDDVDLRVIDEVMRQRGQIINSQDDVEGWLELASPEPPLDSDRDGLPDYWENRQHLDPQNAEDRNLDDDGNGYTELEEYLHYLASGSAIDRTIAEVTESGSIVNGDHTKTHDSDNVYEEIRERSFAGGKQSRLSHIWEFNVTGGDHVTFFFEGHHDSTTEDFHLDYSTDQTQWTELIAVNKNADDGTVQSAGLPDDLVGNVYIRAVDTSNRDGHAATLYVDDMYIESRVEGQVVNDTEVHAIGEDTKYGTVTGGLQEVSASDDAYEELTEEQHAGGHRSRLENRWEFNLDAGNHVFMVEAHLNENAVDAFVFEYSIDGQNWIRMNSTEVTNTVADMTYTFDLNDFTGGTIFVRVIDTDRMKNEPTQDTIYVDEISFVNP